MTTLSRRTFLRTAAVAAGSVALPVRGLGVEQKKKTTICVVKGTDIKKMVAKGIAQLGGWKKFVKQGKLATVKPNVAWISTPEQGGNTDPVLVGEVVAACRKAGASNVVLPEHSCRDAKKSFEVSGIMAAAKKAGGKLYSLNKEKRFRSVRLPKAKKLKEADIAVDVLDTGCLINMPVAKHHGAAKLTLSMKNWMGSVKDRGFWHRNDLHQCIADFSTFVKPTLIILDATRILLTKGPQGPGKQEHPHEIVVGTDPVAVDAYATTLFKKKPFDIPHIKIAHEMDVGIGDLSKVRIVRLEV